MKKVVCLVVLAFSVACVARGFAGIGSGAQCPRGQMFCTEHQCCPCEYHDLVWSDEEGYCVCPPCHTAGWMTHDKQCVRCSEVGMRCVNGKCVK